MAEVMLAKGCCSFSVTVTRTVMLLLLLLLPPTILTEEPADAEATDLIGEDAPEEAATT